MSDLAERRQRFDTFFVQPLGAGRSSPFGEARYSCPCCGYPTLPERGGFELCALCKWEDDGQDDPRADEVRGGPNGAYSLTDARENFSQHLTMYAIGTDIAIARDSEKTRTAKRQMMGAFEAMPTAGPDELSALTSSVRTAEKVLERELRRELAADKARYDASQGGRVLGPSVASPAALRHHDR